MFFNAVKAISVMIPCGLANVPADEEDRKKYDEDNYKTAVEAVVLAQDTLHSNVPFIPKRFYDLYYEILSECRLQTHIFSERWNRGIVGHEFGKSTLTRGDYERTKSILDKFDVLNDGIREYIASLDVVE